MKYFLLTGYGIALGSTAIVQSSTSEEAISLFKSKIEEYGLSTLDIEAEELKFSKREPYILYFDNGDY